MKDPVALNLLYVQATAEIERGWILLNGDTKNRLDVYQKKGRKQEVQTITILDENCVKLLIENHRIERFFCFCFSMSI